MVDKGTKHQCTTFGKTLLNSSSNNHIRFSCKQSKIKLCNVVVTVVATKEKFDRTIAFGNIIICMVKQNHVERNQV